MSTARLIYLLLLSLCAFILGIYYSSVFLSLSRKFSECEPIVPEESGFYNLHHVFTTDCSENHDWQSVGMIESWLSLNKPHNLTRLISCDGQLPNSILRMIEAYPEVNFVQVKTSLSYINDSLAELNKPTAVYQWLLQETINEDYIIVTDCDLILLQPWDIRGIALGKPIGAFGITTDHLERESSPWVTLCGERCKDKSFEYLKPFHVGHVYAAHKRDMLELSKYWVEFSIKIRQSDTIPEKGGRMVDMFAYQFAAINLFLPHEIRLNFDLSHPNDPKCNYITSFQAYHYCQPLVYKNNSWSKYEWTNKNLLDCNGTNFMPLPSTSRLKPEDMFSTQITEFQYHFRAVTTLNTAFAAYKKRVCKNSPISLPFSVANAYPDRSYYN
eukprot:TRINITY_DN2727_c0_g1_i1.p1 TRINITY_DN2727_c0_g1~~TRINITY_DN2727_c0_g1_i1.p1  ORF type:complete len:385 (-),score=37.82 TRINITY_DN2727_c0_g1_i1:129-1283(-)